MKTIDYITIVNSFAAQEGSMGVYTNYIYYTLLITYTDKTKEVRTVDSKNINNYANYIVTDVDAITNQRYVLEEMMAKLEKTLDDKINKITDVMLCPNVVGKKQPDAIKELNENGFEYRIVCKYSNNIPDLEVVKNCKRNAENPGVIDLETIRLVPDVNGLQEEQAISILNDAGFKVRKKYIECENKEIPEVVGYIREDPDRLEVILKIETKMKEKEVFFFTQDALKCDSFAKIKELWDAYDKSLVKNSEEITKDIDGKVYLEKMYGGTNELDIAEFVESIKAKYGIQ